MFELISAESEQLKCEVLIIPIERSLEFRPLSVIHRSIQRFRDISFLEKKEQGRDSCNSRRDYRFIQFCVRKIPVSNGCSSHKST